MPALLHEPLPSNFTTLFNIDDCLSPSPSLPDSVVYALENYPNFKFLPSNYDSLLNAASPATAHFACDDFRMYEFKVRRCMKGRSHDWTECPFAHPGEKARRRDPRRIHYSGAPCPDFRKGSCRRGDACEFAHGVFECWLHPARYRTQVCKDGKNCKRRVCFFAHSPEQLRVLPVSMACAPTATHTHMEKADGSPVGSPRGQFSTMKGSVENFPSHEVFMPSSGGMLRAHSFNSSSAMPMPSTKTHPAAQGSPVTMHLDVSNGLVLRRAMLQNMLAFKGYGANLNAAEYSTMPDGHEGLLEAQMLRSACPILQSHDKAAVCRNISLSSEKNGYDPAVYSHGFASPTSTLEPHTFSPPPLSPPLSPLTSPNGNEVKDSFINPSNGFRNLYMDNTVSIKNSNEPTYMYDNLSGIEGLGFCLQNLQLTHSNDGGFTPGSRHTSVQGGRVADFAQQLQLPQFTRSASNLACMSSKQALWGSSCDAPDSEHSKLGPLQIRDGSGYELDAGKIGEETTNMDNLVPDFGWVSELVK